MNRREFLHGFVALGAARAFPQAVFAAERTGETWLWGGHEHRNDFRIFDLPQTKYLVATHPKDCDGSWLYGITNGKIAARLWWQTDRAPKGRQKLAQSRLCGGIPVPFQDVEKDVIWRTYVGEPGERVARKEFEGADNRGWLFYLKKAVYAYPKSQVAPAATRLAVLGAFHGLRNDRSQKETFAFSTDGQTWQDVPRTGGVGDTWIFEMPASMRGNDIWFKIEAFGMKCDDALSGFAFLA